MPAPKIAGVNLTTNPPHNTRIELNVGRVSVLFSYGSPIGVHYNEEVLVLEGLNRHQQKHANQWRRFDTQSKVSHQQLNEAFLDSLFLETAILSEQLTAKS